METKMHGDNTSPPQNDTEYGESLTLRRYFHDQTDIERLYVDNDSSSKPLGHKQWFNVSCTGTCVLNYISSLVPVFGIIKNYKFKDYILNDIISGISVACLHVPLGLALGILASLSPAQGLYTSFFPIVCYVIFGTSPHISFGTNAVIALFTSEIVESQLLMSGLNTSDISSSNASLNVDATILQFKSATASGTSFLVGVILLAMGFLRLGFITSFMSSSFVSAFTTVAAIHIASSQMTKVFGITLPLTTGKGRLIFFYIKLFKNIANVNVATLIISLTCVIILAFVKDFINQRYRDKMKIPIPIDAILIVVATFVSHFGRLSDRFGVVIVNEIPSGVPAPTMPRLSIEFLGDSFVIAIIIFVLTISIARLCEIKHEYEVDDNQELVAYGMSNFVSSFFGCFPSCVAPPRTMLLSALEAKTTLSGFFTSIFMLLVLLIIGPLFKSLPQAVLAVIIIMAVKNLLIQFKQLFKYWLFNKFDLMIWLGTFLAGSLIDLHYAIYIGIPLCFFTVVVQSQCAGHYTLLRSEAEDLFLESSGHKNLVEVKGIKVFRMESSLYFATSDIFRKRLHSATIDPRNVKKSTELVYEVNELKDLSNRAAQNSTQHSDEGTSNVAFEPKENSNISSFPNVSVVATNECETPSPRNTSIDTTNNPETSELAKNDTTNNRNASDQIDFIILDCSAMSYIDSNGTQMLARIVTEFERINIPILFANPSVFFLGIIENAKFSDNITKKQIFPTISDAVRFVKNMQLQQM